MALNEYTPGSAFPGRMGRTIGESEPAWPAPRARARRRAERAVHRARRHRLRAARLLRRRRSTRRTSTGSPRTACCYTQHAHHGAVLADALVHPHRPQPPLQRHVLHHRRRDRLSRDRNGAIPFENGFLSEILLQHGYNTYAVGKWHLTPAEQISAAGPYDRWPLGRGFERYYGFLGGDTHQYYPDLVYDNHQVEPPKTPGGGLPPDRGPGRQGDRVHRRLQAGGARQAVLPVLRPRRAPRAAPRAQGVGRQVQGQVRRRLGRLSREGLRAPEGARHRAEGRRALAPRPGRAGLDEAARPTSGSCTRA